MALETSATVDFGADAGVGLVLERDTDETVTLKDNESLLRVYPSSANAKLTLVLGRAIRVQGRHIVKKVEEYLTYSDSSSASLSYPPTGSVEISNVRFFGESVVAAFKKDSNSVVVSKQGHGILKVKYTTYCDRYIVVHTGSLCSITPNDADDNDYDPAFVVAEATGYNKASIKLEGPACNGGDRNRKRNEYEKYEPVGLRMEVDCRRVPAIYNQSFNASNRSDGFVLQPQYMEFQGLHCVCYCGCWVRVYPRISNLRVAIVNGAVSAQPVGNDILPVREAITFSGSQSASLSYPPKSSISLTRSAPAVTMFNTQRRVDFAKPGDTVTEVEWTSANSYRVLKGSRKVREEEIITTYNGKTIPCYTYAEAAYSTEYDIYEVQFSWNEEIHWYDSAMLLAFDSSSTLMGSLALSPPSNRGRP